MNYNITNVQIISPKEVVTIKKIITLMLVLTMTFSLCACGRDAQQPDDDASKKGLQVGYAKVSITPHFSVGLGGYSDDNIRSSEGFLEYIYATCIAVTSGEETILIYTIDSLNVENPITSEIRDRSSDATGIPSDKIFVGATHGHNLPVVFGNYQNVEQYNTLFFNATVEAAKKALEDQAPAQLLQAKANHEGMNFVRHYTLDDGTHVDNSTASGIDVNRLVGHPLPSDNQMVLVKFDREGDKKDILMVNWQSHPDSAKEIGYNSISPGFVGPMRNKLEKDTGMLVAYFTGASGNQVPNSRIPSERHSYDWFTYGEALADCAASMIDDLKAVEDTTVKSTHTILPVDVNHEKDHMAKEAKEVYDLWLSSGKDAATALGKTYGFSSTFEARSVFRASEMGEHIDMDVGAFRIGDIGFTNGTYEMFSTNGIFVKENSPFDTTFIIAGCSTYVASDFAYTYHCYERTNGYYARGAAEELADNYITMLNSLK